MIHCSSLSCSEGNESVKVDSTRALDERTPLLTVAEWGVEFPFKKDVPKTVGLMLYTALKDPFIFPPRSC